MKILLVPWGRGMGHIIRCLAIATQAAHSDTEDQVTIVAEEQWDSLIKLVGCRRISYPQQILSVGLWKGWDDVAHVRRSLAADRDILNEVKPDVVLHDQRPTMPIACELAGIPCAGLAQQADLPDFFYEGATTAQLFCNTWSSAFNLVLDEYNLQPLPPQGNWRDLFFRNPILIPSIPEFDPIPEELMGPQVWYVGPLHLNLKGALPTPDFERAPDVPVVFVYGIIQDQQALDRFIKTFQDGSFHLVITALPKDIEIQYADIPAHVSIYPLVNAPTFLPKCDVAVIHGGHGICTAMLTAGIPAVVLTAPGSAELERTNNGKRLESLGVALCISKDAPSERLYNAVKLLTQEATYRENAQQWKEHLRQWDGPKTAWEILTKRL